MENSLSLSVNVPETLREQLAYEAALQVKNTATESRSAFEKKSFITTKELAETLGVDVSTITKTVNRLNATSDVLPKFKQGQTPKYNEQQATIIKQEIQKHHNLESRQIDNVSTEYEENQIVANAVAILQRRSIELQKQIEAQKVQIEALTPDAESWRKFAESDGTFSATNVAKLLKISRDELLDFLKIKHYIMRERSDNPNKKGRWQATALGIERGYVANYLYTNDKISHVQFHITPKGMQKIEQVFCHNELTPEEQKRLEKICKEAEKNMRPSVIGLAE